MLWQYWGEEWALTESVSFNGAAKKITVNAGVTSLDIRNDVYSAWVRWQEREDNARFLPAMRYSGLDPIPGGSTGGVFFLQNGWKLVYDPNAVAVAGVLYSSDFDTAYWAADGDPVYPATVSSLVNNAVTTQNIVTGDLSSIPAAVWAYVARTLTAGLERLDVPVSSRMEAGAVPPDTLLATDPRLDYLDAPISEAGSGGTGGGISPEQYAALMAAINTKSTLTLAEILSSESSGSSVVTEILTADVQTNMPLSGG